MMLHAKPAQSLFLAAGLCCALVLQAAPKDDLTHLRERIKTLQKEAQSTESQKTDATDALKQSEQAISNTHRKLRALAAEHERVSQTLSRIQEESRGTQGKISKQQTLLGELLYQNYLHGQQDAMKILLSGQDINQVTRQLYYYPYVSRARARLISDLRGNLARSQELAGVYREKNAELERLKAEQVRQKAQLEKEKSARKAVLTSINQKIVLQRREIGHLQRNEKSLTQLVERLGKLAARKPKKSASLQHGKLPPPELPDSLFSKQKGRLHLPVRGELSGRFGVPREAGGTTWKGLFIKSPAGQEVKCIADGQVVFSDWLRGFGNILIVDHGDSFMSLYGNNETLFKQAGESVRMGDVIAAVGNSGGIEETGLYFEMRYQSRPFDPMGWVRLN